MLISSRSLDTFINETMTEDPPTPEEELAICERIVAGDKVAKEELAVKNMRLVMYLARQYKGHGVSLEDLVQEGALAAFDAAETFNHTKGFKFSSWAAWYIKNALKGSICNSGHAVKMPKLNCNHNKARLFIEGFKKENGREPTAKEFSSATGISGNAVAIIATLYQKPVELDRSLSKTDQYSQTQGDLMPCDEPSPEDLSAILSDRRLVESLLVSLSARESDVIVRRFGLFGTDPEVLDDIGADHGITRERTRQVQLEALKKMRKQMRRRTFQCEKKLREAVA